jgi:hypothetical protein
VARKFKTPITIDELGSASSQALAANVDGDSQNRINIDAGGKITWGSGSATGDTTLYRSAADTLKTDDAFTATSLAVTGQFTFPTSDGSADQVITTNGSGTLTWSDVSANATVSDTAPSSPATGQIWYESDTGKTFVYYDSAWVEVGASPPASPFITDLDEDTKIQVEESSDEDKIRFDTAGSERMIIDNTGKVGIGTSSPVATVDITSSAGDTWTTNGWDSGLMLNSGSALRWRTGTLLDWGMGATSDAFYVMSSTDSGTGSNADYRMVIDSNGQVGIGNSSPSYALDVEDPTAAILSLNDSGGTVGASTNSRVIFEAGGSTAGQVGFLNTGVGIMGVSNEDGPLYLTTKSADSLLLRTSDSTRVTIDSNGHTYIGNNIQTGQSSFTREPWAASTIALGNYGYVGTAGSYGTSLMWNWERGTDSGYYSLGVNSYTSAAAIHMRNDGIRFQYESSWGATSEPSVHTLMGATELLVYKDLRLYEGNPVITLQDSTNTGAHNGEILFKDQSATILGSVRMNGNDDLSVRAETSTSVLFYWVQGNWRFYMTSSQFLPYADNVYDLGATSKRFDDVYATNGTIQTSDVRDKADVTDIDYGLDFVNSLRPVTYRWNDRSGYVGTRTHMGFVAQEVSTALGDNAASRALWVDSPAGEYKNADTGEYEPGVERQSLRYEEMIAPMVKAIQELTAQNEALTTRIEALEAG